MPAFGGGWPTASVSMTLYTTFQQAPPAEVMDAIRNELDTIMAPAGLRFEWLSMAEAGRHVSPELAVVHFQGDCDAQGLRPGWGSPGALGWTHITDGQIQPFIDIDCDSVRLLLERDLMGAPELRRNPAFGRAIARVLAHELYHLLANTRKHTGAGIAKAVFTPEDLLDATLRFGEKEYAALMKRHGKLVAQAAGENP
ncbi:MAG TPA: hypothetical protein VH640_06915 [Bryobacteraceae bacterium]